MTTFELGRLVGCRAALEKAAGTPIRNREDLLALLALLPLTGLGGAAIGGTFNALKAGLTDEEPGEDRGKRMRKAVKGGLARGAGLGVGIPLLSSLIPTVRGD
jgi:hypothetical protein